MKVLFFLNKSSLMNILVGNIFGVHPPVVSISFLCLFSFSCVFSLTKISDIIECDKTSSETKYG